MGRRAFTDPSFLYNHKRNVLLVCYVLPLLSCSFILFMPVSMITFVLFYFAVLL